MRTSLFSALCVTLCVLTACQKEADFAKASAILPDAEVLKSHVSGDYDVSSINRDDLTRDYCIELGTTHWLVGVGTYQPLSQTACELNVASRLEAGVWVIEASGDGMSDDYARSSSELKLTFNARLNTVSGSMITKFYHGEVLEQSFDGDALVIYDRYAMILKANVRAAHFNNGSEELEQVSGEIIIALPLKPEGWLETNIYTKGMFCTAVVN